jgi:GST-like protein
VHRYHGQDWAPYPNLRRWFDAIAARPAVQRGMMLLDEHRADNRAAAFDARTRDILFGAAQYRRR